MKKLDTAGVLVYTGQAGLIGGLVLNLVVVILWCLFTGGSPYGPVPAAAAETVAMSEELELHHWIVYKADAVQDDMEVAYHLEEALALATDPEHHSLLDGLLEVHHAGGGALHISDTIDEIMHSAGHSEPEEPLELLHASLVHLLLEEGNISEARTQTEHLVALATGTVREQGQEILEAQTKGDIETAKRLVAELIAGQQLHTADHTPAPAHTPTPPMGGGMAGMGH